MSHFWLAKALSKWSPLFCLSSICHSCPWSTRNFRNLSIYVLLTGKSSVFINAHQKMWWPSQNKTNQLNCHIMMTLGTRFTQASGSKLQRVTNKMFYFPLNQCTQWKLDSTSICQLYRKDANFRLGASLSARHSFRVVKFQKSHLPAREVIDWSENICKYSSRKQTTVLPEDQLYFHQMCVYLRYTIACADVECIVKQSRKLTHPLLYNDSPSLWQEHLFSSKIF